MKTKEELNALKSEVEALNKKLAELTEDELKQVSGGFDPRVDQLLTSGIERGGKKYAKDILIDVPPGQSDQIPYLVTDENNRVDYEIYP